MELPSASNPRAEMTKSDGEYSPDTGSSSGTGQTRLTPGSDSEDSDLDVEMGELNGVGGESYKLQSRSRHTSRSEKEGAEDSGEDDEDDDEGLYGRRGSASTVQSFILYTPDEERAVVRKFDRKLVLFVALLYMLSFLDRSNIGNARIAGLDLDLNLDSSRYEWCLSSFYFAYICFEWMSVLWKIVPAHIYVTCIVLSWGIVASLQSVATSFWSLIILRVLLGIGEAGFTGIPFYLSFFFKREELALRTGYFISAAPLATTFASTLAYGIIKLGQYGPIASWRLLFLVEGFPSVLVAVWAYRIIPDSPSTASYLTTRERKVAQLRLRREKGKPSDKSSKNGLNTKEMLATITDPKSYLTAFMFFFTNMCFSSLPVFMPTIIHEMGHSVLVSQALSAPPYLLSFVVVILTAYLSDRLQNRWLFVLFHAILSASGYLFMGLAGHFHLSTWWRYFGLFPAAIGFFSVITIIITWTINNQASESAQGTGFAMLQLIGQCGPLIGTKLYPEKDAPLYVGGMLSNAGAMVLVAALSVGLRLYLGRLNRRGEAEFGGLVGEAGRGLVDGGRKEKFGRRFVYML